MPHLHRGARAWPWRRGAAAVALAFVALAAGAANDPKAARLYEDALTRFEKNDMAGAILQLKNALQIDKAMLPVHVLLGKALLANGEVAAAEVAFNEALQLGVNRAEVVVPLAQSVVGQAKLPELFSSPRFATGGLPGGTRSALLLVLAAAQSDLGSHREAMKLIEEARAVDPGSIDSWLTEIPIQIRSRRFKEAVAAGDKAVALAPTRADAHYLRASVFHAMGQIAPAITGYDRALALAPTHVEARIARAGLYMDQGRLDDVQREVAELRKSAPREVRAAYLGSLAAERKGDTKAARSALADVTGLLDPVPVEFMRYRPQLLQLGGMAHYGLGQNEKARPYLEALLRGEPESPAAKLLAQIYLGTRDVDRAIETLEPYVKRHAADIQAVVLLASAQMAKGRNARGVQLLQDALKVQDTPRLRALLGATLVGSGKLAEALVHLESAYRKDPGQILAGSALVDLYLRNKQFAKAQDVSDALVKRAPKDAQLHTLQGQVRLQIGDKNRARQSFEQALRVEGNFVPAKLNLARLDLATGAPDAAAERLATILAGDDKNIDALIEMAQVAERRGQSDEALRHLTKAFDHSPVGATRAGLLLVELHLRQGRAEAANDAVRRAAEKAPDSLAVQVEIARVRLALKDSAGAQQALTRASRAAEFDPQLQVQIAVEQLAAGDAKGALYSTSKALQAQPDYLPAKAVAVDANVRLGELGAAETLAREVSARQPKLALGPALLGDVAAARGQTSAAVEAYRRAHQIEPSTASLARLFRQLERQDPAAAFALAERWIKNNDRDVDARRLLADAHARQGSLVAARKAYEAVATLAPGDAEVLNNLANVLIQSKDPGALPVAEKALALKPAAPHIIGTAGWAAFQAGQPDRALQLLRDARLRDPANPDTRYFLAATLASKGRQGEARDELQGAMKSGARFAHAKEAEALLKTLK